MILIEYISKNHSKFLIKYHIILVCKYRKQLLVGAFEYDMKYGDFLRQNFYKEHIFWTDGYFVSSIGNVSQETIKKYIENQG